MAKKQHNRVTDQIRQAIDNSGISRYRIAQQAGIDESALAKFYHGTRGLSLDSLDRLCECLGLKIVADDRRKESD